MFLFLSDSLSHIFQFKPYFLSVFLQKSLIAWLTGTNAHNLMVFAMFHASTILKLSMLWFQSFSEKFLWNRRGKYSVEGNQKLSNMRWLTGLSAHPVICSMPALPALQRYLISNPPNLIKLRSHTNLFPTIFTRSKLQLDRTPVYVWMYPPLGNILPIMSEPRILW